MSYSSEKDINTSTQSAVAVSKALSE